MALQLEVISRQPIIPTDKPPILFVHGAWHAAWCWDEHFLPYFAEQGFPVHALSFRAHGQSEGNRKPRGKRITHYVADVAQVATQIGHPPILISHSMGALVVEKYLETHPARAAVYLAPVPPQGVLGTTLRILRRHPGAFLRANLETRLYPIVGSPRLTRDAFFSAEMSDEQVQTYFQQIQDESYLAFLDMLVFTLARPQRVRARNPIPILVLGAAHDRIFTPREVQSFARAYATTAEIFPNTAHDMMLETTWQQVAERINAWLGDVLAGK